jgi:hypothetical protein
VRIKGKKEDEIRKRGKYGNVVKKGERKNCSQETINELKDPKGRGTGRNVGIEAECKGRGAETKMREMQIYPKVIVRKTRSKCEKRRNLRRKEKSHIERQNRRKKLSRKYEEMRTVHITFTFVLFVLQIQRGIMPIGRKVYYLISF